MRVKLHNVFTCLRPIRKQNLEDKIKKASKVKIAPKRCFIPELYPCAVAKGLKRVRVVYLKCY